MLAVYTQPPRPAGRGHRLQPSPVQLLARAAWARGALPGCACATEEVQAEFAALGAEAAVVAAYGLILPRAMLTAPRLGCLNVHASLLPRWRGAAPIQRALLAGDAETGITIMQMEEGLDTGPILMQQPLPIGPAATAAGLTEALARLGGELIVAALDGRARRPLRPAPATAGGRHLCAKDRREEGRLDWRRPAAELERRVRALRSAARRLFRASAASTSACSPRRRCRCVRESRRAPCSTIGWRSPAGPACCGCCGCSGRAARPLDAMRFLARLSDPARNLVAVPRYKLTIEYDGAGLVGWQRQPQGLSVQEALETAVMRLLRREGHGARRRPHRCRGSCAGSGRRISTLRARCRPRCCAARSTITCARPRSACSPPSPRPSRFRRASVGDPARLRLSHPQPARAGGAGARPGVAGGAAARCRGDARRRAPSGRPSRFHDLSRPAVPGEIAAAGRSMRSTCTRIGDEIRIEARARSFLHRQVRNMAGTLELVGLGRWRPADVGHGARRPRPPRRRPDRPGRRPLSGRSPYPACYSRLVNDISCRTLALKSGLQTGFMFNN